MIDEDPTDTQPGDGSDTAAPQRKRRRIIAGVTIAALLLAGGGTATALSINAYNSETVKLCTEATSAFTELAAGTTIDSLATAKTALDAATDSAVQTTIPGATEFSTRPVVTADAIKKVKANSSGAELVAFVNNAIGGVNRAAVANEECSTRNNAQSIVDRMKNLETKISELAAASETLTAEVKAFTDAEQARITAEQKAAEEAAAAVAAQAAAEAEAAAAAQAQAEAEATQQQQWTPQYDAPYNAPYQAPAPQAPAPAPAPQGPGGGSYAPPPKVPGGGGCPVGMNCAV